MCLFYIMRVTTSLGTASLVTAGPLVVMDKNRQFGTDLELELDTV